MTIQLIINIFFSVVFLLWMAGSLWLLWKIWQSNQALVRTLQESNITMQQTIIDNARKNVETINELSHIIEKHHEPPHDFS